MRVEFHNKHLEHLYLQGTDKKYPLPADVIERFFRTMTALEAASDIHDLWAKPSLRFERLQGLENSYSVRVTGQYRLELLIEWENTEATVGIIGIEELSNHYGG